MEPKNNPATGHRIEILLETQGIPVCACGALDECEHEDAGYPYCKRCLGHHRPWPECPGFDYEELNRYKRTGE